MIIGTFLLAVALHTGIVLAVDLMEQHHSTTQSNHS
ncbi:transcriptional regulator [Lysinibacillus sp. NPDC058147]